MKICIVGAGAIGGLMANRLARAGADVSLVARGAQLAAIARRGVTLIERDQTSTAAVQAIKDPGALGPQDMVVLALKAYSLADLAPALRTLLRPDTVILPVQNGIPWWYFHRAGGPLEGARLQAIDPTGAIWDALDPARVVGAVTYSGASVIEPGTVRLALDAAFVFGEPDGTASARLARIVELFARAGFKTEATHEIRRVIWLKLWGNGTVNPVSVLTGTTVDRMIGDARVKAILGSAMVEVRSVAERLGISFDFTIDQRFEQTARLGAFKTSMLQDFEAGRPLEIEAIVGVVVELAQRLGLSVPVMETIYGLTRLRGLAGRPAA